MNYGYLVNLECAADKTGLAEDEIVNLAIQKRVRLWTYVKNFFSKDKDPIEVNKWVVVRYDLLAIAISTRLPKIVLIGAFETETGESIFVPNINLKLGKTLVRRLDSLYVELDALEPFSISQPPSLSPTSKISPVPEVPTGADTQGRPNFSHSLDYRSVNLSGQQFGLTLNESRAIEFLHNHLKNGTPELAQVTILEHLETPSKRLKDVFSSDVTYKALVRLGKTRGTVRLNFDLA